MLVLSWCKSLHSSFYILWMFSLQFPGWWLWISNSCLFYWFSFFSFIPMSWKCELSEVRGIMKCSFEHLGKIPDEKIIICQRWESSTEIFVEFRFCGFSNDEEESLTLFGFRWIKRVFKRESKFNVFSNRLRCTKLIFDQSVILRAAVSMQFINI